MVTALDPHRIWGYGVLGEADPQPGTRRSHALRAALPLAGLPFRVFPPQVSQAKKRNEDTYVQA
jgi:hypothetical protein